MSQINDRVKVAGMFAAARGKKIASAFDFFLADQFLQSGIMLEHDRKVKKETIEDLACRVPDSVDRMMDGTSVTHWLAAEAKKLAD